MDAFDADVLTDAAEPGHPLGEPIRNLFAAADDPADAPSSEVGSVLLLPEPLSKPRERQADTELTATVSLLARLVLIAVDREIADLTTILGSRDVLRGFAAAHLATVMLGVPTGSSRAGRKISRSRFSGSTRSGPRNSTERHRSEVVVPANVRSSDVESQGWAHNGRRVIG